VVSRPQNGELPGLVGELCAASERFRRLWESSTEVASYLPGEEIIHFREPGHTDPEQPRDERHHIPLTMSALTPMAFGPAGAS